MLQTDFFDHVYLVNLRQHIGCRVKALAHLKKYGISPTVFEASDGYMPPLLTRYDAYSEQELGSLSYFTHFNQLEINRNKRFIESAGAFGYIDTYIRILKDAKLKGYQSILVFEDDVLLSVDFNERLKTFCSTLPNTWKFISLGASQYNWGSVDMEQARSRGFYTPKQLDTCGSFAIAIHSTIFDELIHFQSHFEAPFDHIPLGEIYNNYASDCFVVYPNIVMPDVRSSSIRGSRNQLVHAKKMKWEPRLFDYPLKRPIVNLILSSKEQVKYRDAFNDETTFPFELHLFIPSQDGLRPYHDSSQSIEIMNEKDVIYSPNSGHCVKLKTSKPFTEDDLIALYESLMTGELPAEDFEVINTLTHSIDTDRVSVIIPTYRRSENITTVVLSVIEQDYKNKEIIVVDDNPKGSDEQLKTEHIVSSLIKAHPDICLIYISQSKNRNGAGARNTGFMKSTGSYICFLDDDDLYLPGRLSESIDALKTTPSHIGAVYCGFVGWNGAINTNDRYKEGNLTKELLLLDYLSHYLHTNTATYKRDAVIAINGFDETFCRHQDLEFNLRFFEHYDMSAVPKQLISLKPKPTNVNNQQYGIDFFETKLKFLKKFQYIINRFDNRVQKAIYDKHWSEVIKYIPDEKLFKKHLLSNSSKGHLQCFYQFNQKNGEKVAKPAPIKKTHKPLVTEEENSFSTFTLDGNLNAWQIKGTNIFGLIFSKFILPHQKIKLENSPEAFFEDSKNTFTRLVGKLPSCKDLNQQYL